MNTLVTDAGLFDCSDISRDGNIQTDRRRLTLKISDLCRLADDPLDVLYSRRFNIGSDENEKYKKILEDTEPLDSPDDNDLDFSLREKIISYCRGIPDMLHFNDEEESRAFWCDNPVFIYAGLMNKHPEVMSGFSDDLKYSGLIPAGRDAVYKNPETGRKKEFEASEILGFDTRKYFMMGIRRLHYLYSKGYSLKPESVQVRCEFKLYGSKLPEPYCSVFRDSNCAFTVAVEGTVDNIYTRTAEGRSNRKEYLHFRDIHKLQKQKFLFLLNSFLLNHDATGKRNSNGAIFMDQGTNLLSRPYTILLYGHNMKTGAMFGNLRKYEDFSYYYKHRTFQFDTLYEEGEYAIFAVSNISVTPGKAKFVNLTALQSLNREKRQKALDQLIGLSANKTAVDVNEEDQLLLLITCVGDDDERLVVAARRLRDGEQPDHLQMTAASGRKP